MSYTIVGMFPTKEDADKASNKLDNASFPRKITEFRATPLPAATKLMQNMIMKRTKKPQVFGIGFSATMRLKNKNTATQEQKVTS